jgi:signal transduction histidine kinase
VRRRLVLSTVAVIAAALVAFAVPLALATRSVLTSRALDTVAGETLQVANFLDARARTCGEVQLWLRAAADATDADLALFDRAGGLVLAVGGRPAPPAADVATAAQGGVGRVAGDGRLSVAVALTTRACGQPLVLRAARSDGDLVRSVRGAWLAIGVVGGAVLAGAAALASIQGRRMSRPFEALASSARRLGEGDFSARAPRAGLPEADAIAGALDTTADRLGRAVQRGAAFTADASHQLRTPLTALRLHLETLAAAGDDTGAVEAALVEADRLEATIDELVALTRVDAAVDEVDLGALVADRVAAWRPQLERTGRHVDVEHVPVAPGRVRPAAVSQALQVLLDNALAHGRGNVSVRVAPTLPDADGVAGTRICVMDHGDGFDLDEVLAPSGRDRGGHAQPLRGGRGLPLARSLIEGEGGRLVAERAAGRTRVCLVLPGV